MGGVAADFLYLGFDGIALAVEYDVAIGLIVVAQYIPPWCAVGLVADKQDVVARIAQ